MIQVFPADERQSVDLGWLKGYRSFSFGEPARITDTADLTMMADEEAFFMLIDLP